MDIAGLATSTVGGSLFGIFGQVLNRGIGIWEAKEKRKDAQLAYAQEEKRWVHERGLIDLQMKARAEETEHELAITAAAGSWDGLKASVADNAALPPSYAWVGAVRSLVRPILTLETQLLVVLLLFLAPQAGRVDLLQQITEAILFSASTALLWWFGERASNPRGRK